MDNFLDRYWRLRKDRDSVLCIGLDPRPERVMKEGGDVVRLCLDVVDKTFEYAVAYKVNTQFVLFCCDLKGLKEIAKGIKRRGCLSILDHKLSDIGSSNQAAVCYIREAGFDAFTASPFPGNIRETTDFAHRSGLAVFFLALMSNPESAWVQKECVVGGRPLYQKIAEEIRLCGGDGLVLGAGGHVTPYDVRSIRSAAGDNCILLCPGIGVQGGDVRNIMENAGPNVLVNVGRSIFEDEMPSVKAKRFRDEINRYRY